MAGQESPAEEIAALFDEASGDIAVGELEAAVAKYRRCIELDTSFFDGWHALGMADRKSTRLNSSHVSESRMPPSD